MALFRKLAAAVTFAVALPAFAHAETELIFNSYLPPFDPLYKTAILDFAERIQKESGGEIKVTIPDSTLAPSNRQYEMVQDGIADMAIISSGFVPQKLKLFRFADLPLNSPTGKAASVALWKTYNKYLEPYGEFEGLKVLGTAVLSGRQLMELKGLEIAKVGDLKGVKVWTPPGGLSAATQMLGGVPITTEFTELQEYVTKGNVDAMVMTPGSAMAARVLEFTTGLTEIPGGIGSLSFAICISQARWDQLTDDERAAIERAADGMPARIGEAFDAIEMVAMKKLPEGAIHEVSGDDLASFTDILSKQTDDWKESAKAAGMENPDEMLDFYHQALKEE